MTVLTQELLCGNIYGIADLVAVTVIMQNSYIFSRGIGDVKVVFHRDDASEHQLYPHILGFGIINFSEFVVIDLSDVVV